MKENKGQKARVSILMRQIFLGDVHISVHRITIMKITNKMQLYRLIY